jgi:hypothetical protein
MKTMRQLTLTEVPWADGATPVDTPPSDILAGLRADGVRRRSFIRFAAGGAMGVGLAVLGWLPPARPQGAWAHCCLSEWADGCHGFFSSSTTCVPSTAKYSDTCTAGKWHRNDGGSGTCYNFRFLHNHTSCANRNAWRWNRTRCSDGHYEYHDCGGGNVNTFSICRATI